MGLFTSDKNSPFSPWDTKRVLTAVAILVVVAGVVVSVAFDGPVADAFSDYAWLVWMRLPRLLGL